MRHLFLLISIAGSLSAQVSFDRLLNADKEPQNWLTYSGSTMSQRHSLLTQINPQNVKNLEQQWVFQARSLEKFEATPLVVDGIMGTIDAHLLAIDAKNGRPLWNAPVASAESGYAITHAPLVVKDKVIVGVAGGEFG